MRCNLLFNVFFFLFKLLWQVSNEMFIHDLIIFYVYIRLNYAYFYIYF